MKLVAFIAAGAFVTFWMFDPQELIHRAMKTPEAVRAIEYSPTIGNFLCMVVLSFCAILLLPRQFHVSVVENSSDAEVARARWLFPLYLVAINLFVIPIAIAGLVTFPFGAVDSDMFVLALPIEGDAPLLSLLVFIGGLSAATAMVIVECVALSVMLSNDIIVPLVLQRSPHSPEGQKDFGDFLLKARRFAIFAIMVMAYFYYRALGNTQLAAIGLLSFAAIAQLAPAFFGGLLWRRATARGAIGGMVVGFAVWAYTLFIPSFIEGNTAGILLLQHGPFGIETLRPQALFGADLPPLLHGVLWSLPQPADLCRAVAGAPAFLDRTRAVRSVRAERADADRAELPPLAHHRHRAGHPEHGGAIYRRRARAALVRGLCAKPPIPLDPAAPADFELLQHAEHLIASSIGAASSRLVMSLLLRKRTVSAKAALKLLDDFHAAMQFNREILQTALNHVRQGIAVFDTDLQLICSNRTFSELLGLPPHLVQIGISAPRDSRIRGRDQPARRHGWRRRHDAAARRLHHRGGVPSGALGRPPYGDRGALQPHAGWRTRHHLHRRYAVDRGGRGAGACPCDAGKARARPHRGADPAQFGAGAGKELNRNEVSKETMHQVIESCRAPGKEETDPKMVDVVICNLRKRLKPFNFQINTLWACGYFMAPAQRRDILEMVNAYVNTTRQEPASEKDQEDGD